MKKINMLDRILLLLTGLLAAYQIVVGIDDLSQLPIICFTVGFGTLLVSGLLILIMGFDILDSPLTIIVTTILPLSLSSGLIAEYFPQYFYGYLIFAVVGFLAISISRFTAPKRVAVIILASVHGVAGLLIFGLPIYLAFAKLVPMGFSLVGIGGALIGIGGLLLSFLKTGTPILSRDQILTVLPGLLLLMTAAYVAGFAAL